MFCPLREDTEGFQSCFNYRLTKLPQDMGCLPHLEYISCSYNHICSIDVSIGRLRHLRELKLASNKFELFPEELFSLRSLQLIDLSKNHISDIPSGIGRMKVSSTIRPYQSIILHTSDTKMEFSVSSELCLTGR